MNARRLISATLATLCAMAGGLLLGSPPALAASTHPFLRSFGPEGFSAAGPVGEFVGLEGVAVEQGTGDVYVYDGEANEGSVYKFNSAGEPVDFSASGTNVIEEVGETFEDEGEIAVDNSGGVDHGDIYVASGEETYQVRIYSSTGAKVGALTKAPGDDWEDEEEVPCGVAVDSAGNVYVGLYSERVEKFTPKTGTVVNSDYVSSLYGVGEVCNIAADSEGNVYTANYYYGPVFKYAASQFNTNEEAASGIEVDEVGGGTLAVDPFTNDVFIDEFEDFAQYGPSGDLVGRSGPHESEPGFLGEEGYGIAVDHASGDVYVDSEEKVVDIFGPAGPYVSTEAASAVAQTSVTLHGSVNPEGVQVSGCRFEYGTSASYGQSAPCVPGSPGSGPATVAVSADLSGLHSGATYHFRLVASNANGTGYGQDETFTTQPPAIEEFVTKVTSTSATLAASINPLGLDTRYHFEYDTTPYTGAAAHGTILPDADIGAGAGPVLVRLPVQNLQAGTAYYYRVVATDDLGSVDGEDGTFTTQSGGTELVLPDGREYEMVSPPDKHGAAPRAILEGVAQASEDGEAITYNTDGPVTTDPAGSLVVEGQVLSTRGSGGWSSQDIATAHNTVVPARVGGSEYRVFSSDLSLGLVEPISGDTPLSPQASERTVYLRSDSPISPGSPEAANYLTAAGEGGYLPLVTSANVPAGTQFGGEDTPGGFVGGVGFSGATPDLSHVILQSTAALTKTPIPTGNHEGAKSLYEWAEGQLQLLSVLPKSDVPAPYPELGSNGSVRHAVSSDGSRIVWEAEPEEKSYQHHLYMRDTATQETVQLDANQGAREPGEGEPIFQTANAEGSRVFFTDEQRLTADSTAYGKRNSDLYECEIVEGPGGLVCELRDLTVDRENGESAEVQGLVAGASEDGSYVYFVADGVLAPGAAHGTCNGESSASSATCSLYVRHEGTTTFIATLSGEDSPDFAKTLRDGSLTARVSPDGQYLAFMSDRSLTGYDNTDANSGAADEEVFLYDASTNHLVCASCDPSNARPVGLFDRSESLVDERGIWSKQWLAGSIPGWTEEDYQSRYLSDSGRLFFNSADALVPQDVNGKEDVYEYEPPGIGSCQSSSVTFSGRSDGCVGLISSGNSDEESAFLDASAGGNDVFFLTSAQLSPEDRDTVLDVYDARSCETEQCFTPAAAPPPPCDTSDSCKAAPSPQPEIFGPSGSATFSGAGNLAPPQQALAPRPLTRAQKLAKALRACKRKAKKKKRASCEAQARKRYGNKSRGKTSHKQAKRSRKVHAKQNGR